MGISKPLNNDTPVSSRRTYIRERKTVLSNRSRSRDTPLLRYIPFVREETSLRAANAFGKFLEGKENFLISKIFFIHTHVAAINSYARE